MISLFVDTNSVGSRAFYTGDLQFFRMVQIVIDQIAPDYVFFAFDSATSWRKAIYPEYKANRRPQDDNAKHLRDMRIAYLRKLWTALKGGGFTCLHAADYEADDIIGTLVAQLDSEKYVLSGDKDLMQLINKDTKVIYIPSSFGNRRICDAAACIEITGYAPDQQVLYKALVGEVTDNIPGTPKIGPKRAKTLLPSSYSVLVETAPVKANLAAFQLSYKLAQIQQDVPLTIVKSKGNISKALQIYKGLK